MHEGCECESYEQCASCTVDDGYIVSVGGEVAWFADQRDADAWLRARGVSQGF